MAEPTTDVAPDTAELPATKEKLDELAQAASLQYSLKNFSAAADHYADAAEIQSKLNGEMAPENAELLFNYGRALYKVAIAKSDVLGTKVAQEEKKKPRAKKVKKEETIQEEGTSANNGASAATAKEQTPASKPYFQLTGMENWDDSDDEEEDEEEGEGQEEEQDDFGDAFEMFEIARVLYHKQLEALEAGDSAGKGKGKAELTPEARSIKEKLADIYGFLVDLSFENERFHDAIPDARTSLALLEDLHPFGHEKVTSAHYTLSLALEFASMAKIREQQANKDAPAEDPQEQEKDVVDWDLRNEASKQTELAIQNQEAHLKKAEEALSSESFTPERKKELEAELADKKGMLEDLKTRVSRQSSQKSLSLMIYSSRISKKILRSRSTTPLTHQCSKACLEASSVRTPPRKRLLLQKLQSLQMTSPAWSRRRRRKSLHLQQRQGMRRVVSGSWRLTMMRTGRGRRLRKCSEMLSRY